MTAKLLVINVSNWPNDEWELDSGFIHGKTVLAQGGGHVFSGDLFYSIAASAGHNPDRQADFRPVTVRVYNDQDEEIASFVPE